MSGDLFLVPVTNPEFERTAVSPIEIDSISKSSRSQLDRENSSSVRVWGVKNSRLNRKFYRKMNSGDHLLFYNKNKYRYYGKLGDKFETNNISEQYWGDIDADMIYTIEDFELVNIPKEDLNSACDYKSTYQPQSLRRVSNSALWSLKREYGSVEGFVNKIGKKKME